LGKEGVAKIHGLGDLADWEQELLNACLKDLAANIKKVHIPNSAPPKMPLSDVTHLTFVGQRIRR